MFFIKIALMQAQKLAVFIFKGLPPVMLSLVLDIFNDLFCVRFSYGKNSEGVPRAFYNDSYAEARTLERAIHPMPGKGAVDESIPHLYVPISRLLPAGICNLLLDN
jgi:hypothetical protein